MPTGFSGKLTSDVMRSPMTRGEVLVCHWLSIVFVIVAVCFAGCGQKPTVVRHEVSGVITRKGKAVPRAQIRFLGMGGGEKGRQAMGFGNTDEAGRFELRDVRGGIGVPVGEYQVTVTMMPEGEPVVVGEGGEVGMSPRAKPPREYTTTATVTAEGPNELSFDFK